MKVSEQEVCPVGQVPASPQLMISMTHDRPSMLKDSQTTKLAGRGCSAYWCFMWQGNMVLMSMFLHDGECN